MNVETLSLAALALVEASGDEIAAPQNVSENRAHGAWSRFALRYATVTERAPVPWEHQPGGETRDGL